MAVVNCEKCRMRVVLRPDGSCASCGYDPTRPEASLHQEQAGEDRTDTEGESEEPSASYLPEVLNKGIIWAGVGTAAGLLLASFAIAKRGEGGFGAVLLFAAIGFSIGVRSVRVKHFDRWTIALSKLRLEYLITVAVCGSLCFGGWAIEGGQPSAAVFVTALCLGLAAFA